MWRHRHPTSRSLVRWGVTDIELERSQWCERLEQMSTECAGLQAAVTCAGRRTGPACGPVRLPLRDIGYDEDQDLLTAALGGAAGSGPELTLYVERPRRLIAAELPEGRSLLVTQQRGGDLRILLPRCTAPSGAQRAVELQRVPA